MVTDELIGLPAELRKVAKTTEEIDLERAKLHLHNLDRIEKGQITRAQDRDEMEAFRKIAWLPAGLAAKEIQRIRKLIRDLRKAVLIECKQASIKTDKRFYLLLKVIARRLKEVEEALK